MYYSAGNFEAFAHPRKPEGIEDKSAYIIGTGLAALTAAFYLVRDAQMPGDHIHVYEKDKLPGGALDGAFIAGEGYVMRGGREMDNHFEVMWDVYRDVPSIEDEHVSMLDYYYWLNKEDPNYSLCRATVNRGQDAHTDNRFDVSDEGCMEILKLYLATDEELANKKISDYFDDKVLDTKFWMYWRTMFAFENWDSALEMKRYIHRYIHHIGGLPDFSALRFTRYNQYESMILPLVNYLKAHGVQFHMQTSVDDVTFEISPDEKGPVRAFTNVAMDEAQRAQAENGAFKRNPYGTPNKKVAKTFVTTDLTTGKTTTTELTENDLVFITNGGLVESTTEGNQTTPAGFDPSLKPGNGWDMWNRIAAVDPSFGHPEKFIYDPNLTKWMSATATTLDDAIPPYIEKITGRSPFGGHVVTGGIVTVEDSNWLMSWTVNRQQQFRDQPKDQVSVWIYGLFADKPGNYVHKPMQECTGEEIAQEWLYHMGVPEDRIEDLAKNHCNTVPVMMPYIDAFFMPRELGDRPDVVPDGAVNFAFIGQFAEEPRDTIFTTEYSMRTGMESVYTLCDVDRGVPEVWNSEYDVRDLLNAAVKLRDGQPLTTMGNHAIEHGAIKMALGRTKGTEIYEMLKVFGVVQDHEHPVDMKPGMHLDEAR
ncbi:oleate hydratase [Bifidobacterium cuniculi]|uniref:Myosin-cross-reactive antigen n=1 Tax=Bifidobacterium cuniculi TaxID=1688 RepID=A0A087AM14_9BIFI|nr:oleate hydratase [Bifidobacterium cuniculi]KFI59814.1 myosin-cross-reactive antigen [Bifidobacterium cuniculi]